MTTPITPIPAPTGEKRSRRKAAKVEIIRHGRDEMNLVEYPFASLWKNTEPGTEILHEWEATHPLSGRVVKAFWRVAGDAKMGLPTATDEQVYLVLMELTQETGLQSRTVHFTRHNLIKRLGWTHNDKNYRLLEEAFTRLAAVSITSQNAFWNARARSFETVGFSLLDNFKILEERAGRKKVGQAELPLSFFKWNDVLFDSFQAGYIRSLDVGFALTLKSSIALRLYRYLDKKSYGGRPSFEIELAALCERHLGMRPSPYPSKYKERLKPAHEELMAHGFLQSVVYAPMKTKKGEKVSYVFAGRTDQNSTNSLSANETDAYSKSPVELGVGSGVHGDLEVPTQDVPPEASPNGAPARDARSHLEVGRRRIERPSVQTPQGEVSSEGLLKRIQLLGVSLDVAQALVRGTSTEQLQLQLDCLEDRVPRNRAAIFVKAVRESWEAPSKYLERQEAQERAQRDREAHKATETSKAAQKASERERRALQERDEAQLDALWEQMEPADQERIESEARRRLGVLGQAGRAQGALKAMRRNLLREQMLPSMPAENGKHAC